MGPASRAHIEDDGVSIAPMQARARMGDQMNLPDPFRFHFSFAALGPCRALTLLQASSSSGNASAQVGLLRERFFSMAHLLTSCRIQTLCRMLTAVEDDAIVYNLLVSDADAAPSDPVCIKSVAQFRGHTLAPLPSAHVSSLTTTPPSTSVFTQFTFNRCYEFLLSSRAHRPWYQAHSTAQHHV